MCGIAGFFDFGKEKERKKLIAVMLSKLKHRGPDASAAYLTEEVALGHNRLSIIDLSKAGKQPMPNEDKSIWIVFNGEIYNYKELRNELEKKGHRFSSNTDTEVIVHSYEEFGYDCVKKFNGMWAFCIYDSKKKLLFLSRDRLGIKPLYYFFNGKSFFFSSEIKGLLAIMKEKKIAIELNNTAAYKFLSARVSEDNNECFFKGIYQLEPATIMLVSKSSQGTEKINVKGINANEDNKDKDNKKEDNSDKEYRKEAITELKLVATKKRYWKLCPKKKKSLTQETIKEFYKLLADSVKLRLRADVKISCSLSGGLDSSAIVALTNKFFSDSNMKFDVFSVKYNIPDDPYDESYYAELVFNSCKSAKANWIVPKLEDVLDELPKLIKHQEEPIADASMYAHYKMMQKIAEKGIKVVLTGQGGDEVLAGYISNYAIIAASYLKKLKPIKAFSMLKAAKQNTGKSMFKDCIFHLLPIAIKNKLRQHYDAKAVSGLIKKSWLKKLKKNSERYSKTKEPWMSDLDFFLWQTMEKWALPGFLHYDDRNSMAFGIETRVPFLDYRLVEFMFGLDDEAKLNKGFTKLILRKAMKKIVPEKVLFRKDKQGFYGPIQKWLGKLEDKYKEAIEQTAKSCEILEELSLEEIRKTQPIEIRWRILSFSIWYMAFIKEQPLKQHSKKKEI